MTFADSTRCVHSGMPAPAVGEPLSPGPALTSIYHLRPEGYQQGDYGYGRPENPTREILESALGQLEGGTCLAFASGQAAVTALFMSVLRPGDTVVIPSDGYYNARVFGATVLSELDINVLEAPTSGPYPSFAGVRLVLLESPSNPGLDLVDISAVATAAHAEGALVAVDNTTATPLGQTPLSLGADIVVASGTKAISGHSDLLLGYLAAREQSLLDSVEGWRKLAGGIPGAFECWLARRSLSTLALRLRQQSANAAALVPLLRSHPLVSGVRWPGDSPFASQLRITPGLVSFELPSATHVAAFFNASTLVAAATSFGGVHTTADRRLQWGDPVSAGFVRLSCGIEDTSDLLTDIETALAAAAL
ncbi:MAG TPA: cystathionine gamma-lyase [Candidatus Limnocylindrales bacterium]